MYKPPKRRKLTKAERQAVYDKCAGHCAYCGCELTMRDMQVEHIIAMDFYDAYAAMGQDIDTMGNYLPACRSCNHYKHTLNLEEFRSYIESINRRLERDSVTYRNAVRFGMVIPNQKPVVFYFEQLEGEANKLLRKMLCNACENQGWETMDRVAACNCCENGEFFAPEKSNSLPVGS